MVLLPVGQFASMSLYKVIEASAGRPLVWMRRDCRVVGVAKYPDSLRLSNSHVSGAGPMGHRCSSDWVRDRYVETELTRHGQTAGRAPKRTLGSDSPTASRSHKLGIVPFASSGVESGRWHTEARSRQWAVPRAECTRE